MWSRMLLTWEIPGTDSPSDGVRPFGRAVGTRSDLTLLTAVCGAGSMPLGSWTRPLCFFPQL